MVTALACLVNRALVVLDGPFSCRKNTPTRSTQDVSFSRTPSNGAQVAGTSAVCTVGRGLEVQLYYLHKCLYLPVREPQSESSTILCNMTAKQTFNKVFGACNLSLEIISAPTG